MSDGLYLTDEEFIAIDQKTQRLRKAMNWWRERCRAVKYWEPAAKSLAEDYEAKVAALEARCAGLEGPLLELSDRIGEGIGYKFESWEMDAFLRELRADIRAALADTTTGEVQP